MFLLNVNTRLKTLCHASVAAASSLCALGSPASASTVTYIGTVTSDYENNAFGSSGSNTFVGDTVTLTFTENLANGYQDNSLGLQREYGGSVYGNSTPVSNGTLSIMGGPSFSEPGSYDSQRYNQSPAYYGSGYGEQLTSTVAYSSNYPQTYNSNLDAYVYGPNVPQFGNYTVGGSNNGYFQYYLSNFNNATDTYQNYGFIKGNITSVSSGVPEPSTWAMMLFGFAGLGFAGYRQSKKSATAFAIA